jgi:O-acetyl-ADP-ribose deacetylase (regulator of RNase III)
MRIIILEVRLNQPNQIRPGVLLLYKEIIMIKEISGDILSTKAEAIAHGVAPFDHFNQGLALSLKEEWPAMARDFRHYCHLENPKPGTIWIWSGPGGKRIINLLTQEASDGEKHSGHPGKASISNVRHALKNLAGLVKEEKIRTLALPRLASGVGGLAWQEVKPLIEEYLINCGAEIELYTDFKKKPQEA